MDPVSIKFPSSTKNINNFNEEETQNKMLQQSVSCMELPPAPISLSVVVQNTNDMISKELAEFRAIETKERERYKELEEVDCARMLNKTNIQLKVMHQLLDRLIPSDDSHTVITEGKSYSIEVMPSILMAFRVPCKNANSPAKFTITFET